MPGNMSAPDESPAWVIFVMQGAQGIQGIPGPHGLTGADGQQGIQGPPGSNGTNGAPGAAGQKGADGINGAPGQPGQDGVTPHIGGNGNWFLGQTDTEVPAQGPVGPQGIPGQGGGGSSGVDIYGSLYDIPVLTEQALPYTDDIVVLNSGVWVNLNGQIIYPNNRFPALLDTNKTYFVMDNIVPNMTAASQNGYILTSSGVQNSTLIYNAFNSNTALTSLARINSWIAVQLPAPQSIDRYAFTVTTGNGRPNAWRIEGSNDGTNWNVLDTKSGMNIPENTRQEWVLDDSYSYLYFRVYVVQNMSSAFTLVSFQKIEFYNSAQLYTNVRAQVNDQDVYVKASNESVETVTNTLLQILQPAMPGKFTLPTISDVLTAILNPPNPGTYTLQSINGVIQWVEVIEE